jgi:hypothetical protein
LVLRRQPAILQRRAPRRPHLGAIDRLIFVWAYRLRPAVHDAICISQPERVVHRHRAGFRWYCAGRLVRSAAGRGSQKPVAAPHPRHERSESAVRRAAHSRRTDGARHQDRAVNGRQVHGTRGRRSPNKNWRTFLATTLPGLPGWASSWCQRSGSGLTMPS